jgi:hypothetical protein
MSIPIIQIKNLIRQFLVIKFIMLSFIFGGKIEIHALL